MLRNLSNTQNNKKNWETKKIMEKRTDGSDKI